MNALHCAVWLAALVVAVPAQEPAPQPPPPANYVVHEWGTFTSMVSASGIALEGLHHEEESLPKFVHDLLKVAAYGETKGTKMPASLVTQKMETPVLYFYAEQALPLPVQVEVWFRNGLMSQFYPLPTSIYPELADAKQQRIDMSKVEFSSLHWDIDILPKAEPAPPEIPVVAADDPWSFARQTGANLVRTRPAAGSPAKAEAEHYLFYRGLGRWQPAVTLRSEPQGKAILTNGMEQPIPFCMALELGSLGGRFTTGSPMAPHSTQTLEPGAAAWIANREHLARQVGATVMQALVKQGLYLDEARAMVATWSRSWFQKDGARIIYLLPREQVDAVLPLSLEPRPKELVRVLVARLEYITLESQQRVEQALRDRAIGDAAGSARAAAVFASLDRFLEPHLRNIAANGSAADLRRAATALAESIR